jgi:iron complex outermembrane recepter protein
MTALSTTLHRNIMSTRALRMLPATSLSLAIALAAQPACAQQSQSAAAADTNEMAEIVVTAQKREEKLQNVPISIAVLGGQQLDKQISGVAWKRYQLYPGFPYRPAMRAV